MKNVSLMFELVPFCNATKAIPKLTNTVIFGTKLIMLKRINFTGGNGCLKIS